MNNPRRAILLLAGSLLILLSSPPGVVAEDRSLQIVPDLNPGETADAKGANFALIIGIDRYQEWMPLHNAVSEAKDLKAVLENGYEFDRIMELYDQDATVSNIRKMFTQTLPALLGPNDSLLIFYSGHGHLDESKSGFWIPVDGGKDQLAQVSWFSNAQLRNYVGLLRAKRILIMADSCFSGELLSNARGETEEVDSAYFQRALKYTARQVLTAGASEVVPDESEFGRQLVSILKNNADPMVDPISLFDRLRRGVTQTLPLFGTLPGNERGGSFIFFRKATPASPLPVVPPLSAPAGSVVAPADLATQLSVQLSGEEVAYGKQKTWALAGFVLGLVGAGVSIYGLVDGKSTYPQYQTSTDQSVTAVYRNQLDRDALLVYAGLGTCGVGLSLGTILWLLDPTTATRTKLEKVGTPPPSHLGALK